MKIVADNIPDELKRIPQWVGWKFVAAEDPKEKPRKLPIDPHTGKPAAANRPGTWGTFDEATRAVERFKLDGVGFMFTDATGFTGIDFDDCIVGGKMTPAAAAVVKALNSYTEISPSGCGVKMIVRASKPVGAGCKVERMMGCSRVEVYDRARYFTVTGRRVPGTPATVENRQAELTALCAKLWPDRGTVGKKCTPSKPPKMSQLGGCGAVERCRRYLAKIPESVSGNNGHDKLLRAGCECFRFGLSVDDARGVLQWFNESKCEPVWSADELEHKLTDAARIVEESGEFGTKLQSNKPAAEGVRRPWHNDLPAWIRNLERPRLRPYQTAILQAIADRCDAKPIDAHGSIGNAIIGFDELSRRTGMARRTAFNHVKRLAAMGLLAITERGGIDFRTGEIRANVYAIPGAEGVKIRCGGRGARLALHHPLAKTGCKTCQPSKAAGGEVPA